MDTQITEGVSEDYLVEVGYILSNREFLSLGNYFHHRKTSRLAHSINVSYLSWVLARKLKCDENPKAAMKNSSRVFGINEREQDAIRTHMFPLGPVPRNKEAWIITLADKICAIAELCSLKAAFCPGTP